METSLENLYVDTGVLRVKPRVTPYNLRSSRLNIEQSSYNSKCSFMVHLHMLYLTSGTDCQQS